MPIISAVHRAARSTAARATSTAVEATGSNVKVCRVVGRYLLNATVGNGPEIVHAPTKMGRWAVFAKYQCASLAIHAKCGRTGKMETVTTYAPGLPCVNVSTPRFGTVSAVIAEPDAHK